MIRILGEVYKKLHIIQNIYLKNKFFFEKKSYSMEGEDLELLKITKNIGPAITPYPTPIAACKKEAQKTIIPIIKNVSMLMYYKPSK